MRLKRRFSRFSFLLAGALALAGCAEQAEETPSCIGAKCDEGTDISTQEFEYIVVGSGAGGGPLAVRLAREGHSVLLLEAGEDMANLTTYQVPALHTQASEDPGMAWSYFVEHYGESHRQGTDSKRTEEGIHYPRGGTLGGSTAVNAMINVVPQNSDWDHIAELTGDETWRASNMEQYYRRVQGWLSMEWPDPMDGLVDPKLLAIVISGIVEYVNSGRPGPDLNLFDIDDNIAEILRVLLDDINEDILAGEAEGTYAFPLATRKGKRYSTRDYIVDTVNEASFPLTVRTRSFVTNVVYGDRPGPDGKPRVIGVDFLDGAHLYKADAQADADANPKSIRVSATREVILSAGAFNTPQLLKLSGLGPRAELESFGIPVVADLPGVGENLQDRYEIGVVGVVDDPFSVLTPCTMNLDENDDCMRDWRAGKGLYRSNGGVMSFLMKSTEKEETADLHIFGVPGAFKGYYPGYSKDLMADKRHFTWVVLKGHTDNSAGTVKLRSANPLQRPKINFHYFDDGNAADGGSRDLAAMVKGIRFVREIEEQTNSLLVLDSYDEVWPGTSIESDQQLGEWVKSEAWGHHASCSAKIGADSDPMAVLDSRFRVRGVSGLRVVDASVFPKIPGTFIAMPIFMASEKAADVILEDATN